MYTADFFDSLLNCIKGTDKKMKKGGFLEGTKLTGYSEQKPKKKGKLLKKAADTTINNRKKANIFLNMDEQ